MSSIRQMPQLHFLDLTDTDVTAEGIAQLVDHPWLIKLDLSGDVLTDEAVTHLNAMPRFQALRLKDFNNDQLSRLDGLKKLDLLLLRGATDQSLPVILQLRPLQYLVLEDSQLSDKSVEELRKRFPKSHIHQRMSYERSLELGIPQRLAAQERLKRTIFIAVALGGGCLVLFLAMLWRRRYQHS